MRPAKPRYDSRVVVQTGQHTLRVLVLLIRQVPGKGNRRIKDERHLETAVFRRKALAAGALGPFGRYPQQ